MFLVFRMGALRKRVPFVLILSPSIYLVLKFYFLSFLRDTVCQSFIYFK